MPRLQDVRQTAGGMSSDFISIWHRPFFDVKLGPVNVRGSSSSKGKG